MDALAGFERIELTPDVFERPAGFDLTAWLQRSFGVWQEEVHDVEWRFTPEAAPEARLYLFHPTQEMIDEPDGSLTGGFAQPPCAKGVGICSDGGQQFRSCNLTR